MVAWALLWYTAGLVGHSVVEIVSRAFYAVHDTRTPVTVGVGAMGLNVVLSLILPGVFAARGWLPLGGLALANSLATFLEMLVLLYLMRRRLKGFEEGRVLRGLGQAAAGSALMGLGVWGWMQVFGSANVWLIGVGGIAIGGLLFGLYCWAARLPELVEVWGVVRRRLSGRSGVA